MEVNKKNVFNFIKYIVRLFVWFVLKLQHVPGEGREAALQTHVPFYPISIVNNSRFIRSYLRQKNIYLHHNEYRFTGTIEK